MNSRFAFAAAIFGLGLCVSPALGAPYLGFDIDAKSLGLEPNPPATLAQSGLGVDIHGGYRFDNLAAELGYGFVRGGITPDNLRLNQLTLDGLYYVPLGNFLNLVVTAGGADTNYGESSFTDHTIVRGGVTKLQRQGISQFGGDEFDWRAGGGFAFNFFEGYEFRVLTRYQPLSLGGRASNALTFTVGLNFYF